MYDMNLELVNKIDKVREHIKNKITKSFEYDYCLDTSNPSDRLFTETVIELQNILQIIDKALGGNNE